jgi:hypothetical protein
MAARRSCVLAANDDHEIELFKVELLRESTVISSSLVNRLVGTSSIHVTHHLPKAGKSTRIIHISDSRGTDVRIQLDPAAKVVELPRM